MDWSGCSFVVSRPGYLSGKPALRDDPRVPPETIVVNMDDDMTAREVAEMFDLMTPISDIQAIYDYAQKQRAQKQRAPSPV
jgi:uncharacterized protein (DUF433 family)